MGARGVREAESKHAAATGRAATLDQAKAAFRLAYEQWLERAEQESDSRAGLTYISAMLRMRKKPPADIPKINSGKDWSPMDMADLLDFHESGDPFTSAGRFPRMPPRRPSRPWVRSPHEPRSHKHGCSVRKVNMTISLAFLAPDLVSAAIEGRLPHGMGVVRLADLPAEWSRQYQMLGLPAQ